MEEKGIGPLIFVAGVLTAAGLFKAKRHVAPALKNAKVFLAQKMEYLEDIFARLKAPKRRR